MQSKIIIIVIVLAVLVFGGFMLLNSNTANQTVPATTQEMNSDNVQEVNVSNNGLKFNPATITVTKGTKVRLTFKSSGGSHNWTVDDFNAATKTIGSGEQDTVEFVADKAGAFEYYCSVSNHRQMGMKGTLTVQ